MAGLRYSFKFKIEQSKDANILTPVRCWVFYNKNVIPISTGIKIEPQYWDTVKEQPKASLKIANRDKVVKSINNIRSWIIKAFDELSARDKAYPEAKEFKELCKAYIKGDGVLPQSKSETTVVTFLIFAERIIEQSKSGKRIKPDGTRYANDTIKAYSAAKRVLENFAIHQRKNTILFSDINMAMYLDLKEYMLDVLRMSDNYFGAVVKFIKSTMNEAREEKLHDSSEYLHKRFLRIQVDVENVYLDESQLSALATLDLTEDKRLERVRDLFLVGCWTGLRFSDFNNIKPENIQGDFIEIKTQKTGQVVAIPIHQTIKDIMARYDGITPNSLPPAISNVKLNAYIKEVGNKAGFDKLISLEKSKAGKRITITTPLKDLITTHTARRAFASNMFKMGVPSIIIMAITGHTTEKSFMKYIKVTPREKAEMLKEIWNRKAMKAI